MELELWQAIVDSGYAPPAGHTPAEMLPALLAGLASPDPHLRDDLAYAILATWIGRGIYTPAEMRAIARQTLANLSAGLGESGTATVFLRSFSALILGEVIDADNVAPFLSRDEVQAWLSQALAYARAERDLRGYIAGQGWAHAAAHMADLLQAFARNRHLAADGLEGILEAIGARVNALSAHAFHHLEDERLARAVVVALRRDLLALPFLAAWLEGVAGAWDGQAWRTACTMKESTNACHNTRQFLRSLYFQLLLGAQPPKLCDALLPHIIAGLRTMDTRYYAAP